MVRHAFSMNPGAGLPQPHPSLMVLTALLALVLQGCSGEVYYPEPSANETPAAAPAPDNNSDVPEQNTPVDPSAVEPSVPEPTPLTPDVSAVGEPDDCEAAAGTATAILESTCGGCHGPGGMVQNFLTVLDTEALLREGRIVPGDPEASPIYARIERGEMPPPGRDPRPSEDDLIALYQWIGSCLTPEAAPGGDEPETCGEPYIEMTSMLRWMTDDIARVDLDDRRFIRYLTLSHIHNAGGCAKDMEMSRFALFKAVNALSLGTQIIIPEAVDPYGTIYRIDLRDYRWEARNGNDDKWEELVDENPYAIEFVEDDAEVLKLFTETDVPFQYGDWLVNAATQPPLYHTMLEIPSTLPEFEQQLGVNIQANIRNEEVWRSGFLDSGVSLQNRVLERHEIPVSNTRALWVSYDFAGNGGLENIFANPLDFEADGSEIIFSLPNGLHGYLIVNAAGNRLDEAPDNIVVDPGQDDGNVRNGISCMSCHESGIKPKADELREFVEGSTDFDFDTKRAVSRIYPPVDEFSDIVLQDATIFLSAIKQLHMPDTIQQEPIIVVFNEFEKNVTLERAAAELGIRPVSLQRELGGLDPALLPLSTGTVQREVFRDLFAETVCILNIGVTDDNACDGVR